MGEMKPGILGDLKNRFGSIASLLGRLLTIASLVFIGYSIAKNWDAVADFEVSILQFLLIALLSVTYGILVLVLAVNWYVLLETVTASKIPFADAFRSHTDTQIYKYVPGNVAHFVMRHIYVRRYGADHKELALALVLENTLLPVAAVLLVAIAYTLYDGELPFWGVSHINENIRYILIAIGAAGALVLIWRKLKDIRAVCLSLILCGLFLSGLGVGFYLLAREFAELPFVIALGATALAWLVGFVTPGSPGGLGTREVTFMFLLSNQITEQDLLLVLVLFRLVTTIGDCVCWALGRIMFSKVSVPTKP